MEYVKFQDKNFALKQKVSGLWKEKTCYLCGKHLKDNESIALIVLPSDIRFSGKYKKMRNNQVVHTKELENLIASASTMEEVADILEKSSAKTENLTEEEKEKIQIFINAAYTCGFKDVTKNSKGVVEIKKYGTSDKIRYNVYSDDISYHNKRKKQLFDSFLERQQVTDVYNAFHKLLGDNKSSDYDAISEISECFSKAVETTNKIMGGN